MAAIKKIMEKLKKIFVCSECGYESPKWMGKCPDCGSWNSFDEEILEEEDELIDEQIDNMIQTAKAETDDDDNQPLDIDAMFSEPTTTPVEPVQTQETTKSNKLAIDSIFNVETEESESTSENATNENLAEDFDQYINGLENKEA